MSYTTNQLIAGAYYAAGVVSREFETVSGTQYSDGINWLNDIISEKRIDGAMIPYETTYKFRAVEGQEKYWIPDLVQIDTLVFYLNKVRFSMKFSKRNMYFGSSRVEGIQSLPYNWYFEKQLGGGNLYIYFRPDQNYEMEAHGMFGLKSVSLLQDLTVNNVIANLGNPIVFSATDLELNPGQFVVNNVDLAGTWTSVGALINYINTGVIPGVVASLSGGNFVLSSTSNPLTPININSTGIPPIGTRSVGTVKATPLVNIVGVYNNANNGVGATLTFNSPSPPIFDTYAAVTGDRILLHTQTNVEENGIYILTSGNVTPPFVLTRAPNYNKPSDIQVGDLVTVTDGILFKNYTFEQLNTISFVGFPIAGEIKFSEFKALSFVNFSTVNLENYEVFNAIGFDQFYITYMRYALADRICSEYSYDTPQNVKAQLSKYESWINKKSRVLDLQMEKVSTLQKSGGISWAFVNLGKGFIPS